MGQRRPSCAILVMSMGVAGCVSSQPDQGRYSTTAPAPVVEATYQLPRDRQLLVASVPGQPPCATAILAERLSALGVSLEPSQVRLDVDAMSRHQRGLPLTAEESAVGLDQAVVLALFVTTLEGPPGGWRPMDIMDVKSAHNRSDVGLAVYDGRLRRILWSNVVRSHSLLQCDDPELIEMIRTMTSRIR